MPPCLEMTLSSEVSSHQGGEGAEFREEFVHDHLRAPRHSTRLRRADHLFQNTNPQKEQLRQLKEAREKEIVPAKLLRPVDVWQKIVQNHLFEHIAIIAIALNAVWLWIDADYNDKQLLTQADPGFQAVEHLFCLFFTVEWIVRLLSFNPRRMWMKDSWFLFDSALLALMITETWIMYVVLLCVGSTSVSGSTSVLRVMRLFRLLRMARMVRLLRAMPELLILIRGMVAATKPVCYTLCLLILLMYVFAIIFVHLTKGTDVGATYFGSVGQSMYTLLVCGTFWDNIGKVTDSMLADGYSYFPAFLVFIMLASLMVMNLLIGVLCEVVSAVSSSERDDLKLNNAKTVLTNLLKKVDLDGNNAISKQEFLDIIGDDALVYALQEVGLDVMGLLDLVDDIFEGREISIDYFMETISKFRGSHAATLKDMVDLRKHLHEGMDRISEQLDELTPEELKKRASNRVSRVSGANQIDGRAGGGLFNSLDTSHEPQLPGALPRDLSSEALPNGHEAPAVPAAPTVSLEADFGAKPAAPESQQSFLAGLPGRAAGPPPVPQSELAAQLSRLADSMQQTRADLLKEAGSLQAEMRTKIGDLNDRAGRLAEAVSSRVLA